MSKDPETESHPGPLDGFGIEPFQPNESPFVGDTSRPERDESQPSEPVPELEHADESPSVGDESPPVGACPSCDQGDESVFSLQPEIKVYPEFSRDHPPANELAPGSHR